VVVVMIPQYSRPSTQDYFLDIVEKVATRGSCARRKVGCVLVNKLDHILSTGYNGPPSELPNCSEHNCSGAHFASGEGLDVCEAVHAEQNALLQCSNVQEIVTAYCTTAPCIHCLKLLLNTSCEHIVFIDDYPGSERCKQLWEKHRTWTQVPRK